ncbi:MAG: substrate-binding domain-containing protein [Burkholderiales bacterium]|nr:substrate-binding domain-containing protein [Burkholderiales bacterium]
MEDLAALAGVSKITVSRALRDSALVTPETRAKIKALAEQVGYRLNHHARNLRLQRSHTVAVVLEMQPDPDRPMSEPYPLQLLGGITQELTSRRYNVLLTAMQSVSDGFGMPADGIILLGQGAHDAAVHAVARCGLPFVVWGEEHRGSDQAVVVGSDNHHGGTCVAERFLELGRSELLFLGDVSHAEVHERRAGFVKRLHKAGIKVHTLLPGAFTFGAGFAAVQAHLRRCRTPPDGLFAASDLLAMGAVRAFSDAGLAVPDAVSVVGYDDSPSAQTFAPPLSSVHQDWRQGGVLLARKVLDLIEGRPAHSETMPTALVVRAT